jgi:hypothetical protein
MESKMFDPLQLAKEVAYPNFIERICPDGQISTVNG